MTGISLCDFVDSFTLNIYCELQKVFPQVKIDIIAKRNIAVHLLSLINQEHKHIVILGPGPGHPNEYADVLDIIPRILHDQNIFTMGICLGHQLIWQSLGAAIGPCINPRHGQTLHLKLDEYFSELLGADEVDIFVQLYNSLAVQYKSSLIENHEQKWKLHTVNQEVIMSSVQNLITYQFHPESIGTTCPRIFFRPIEQFLL